MMAVHKIMRVRNMIAVHKTLGCSVVVRVCEILTVGAENREQMRVAESKENYLW